MRRNGALQKENERLRREVDLLSNRLKMSDADWELGKKSPRDLAIKWLCRAVSVSSYNWGNQELLMSAIDRLLALDNAQNAKNQCCNGNNASNN